MKKKAINFEVGGKKWKRWILGQQGSLRYCSDMLKKIIKTLINKSKEGGTLLTVSIDSN